MSVRKLLYVFVWIILIETIISGDRATWEWLATLVFGLLFISPAVWALAQLPIDLFRKDVDMGTFVWFVSGGLTLLLVNHLVNGAQIPSGQALGFTPIFFVAAIFCVSAMTLIFQEV